MPKDRNGGGVIRAVLAGLFNALFMVLAFPPFSLWGFAFLIPLPLFALARSKRLSPSRAAFWGAIGSLPGWIWTHYWVSEISVAGVIPLVINLAFFTFLFIWIATHLTRRFGRDVIVLPVVWVGIEFFRGSIVWSGYPWYFIAHPLIDSPLGILATPASLGGVYLVSYLCATYSVFLLLSVSSGTNKERKHAGYIAAVIFALWIGVGYLLIAPDQKNPQSIRVGVVQPDVPQDIRMGWTVRQRVRDWLTLRNLTIAVASDPKNPEPIDVIIWPEGFVPGWTLDPISLATERSEHITWSLTQRTPDDVPELRGLPSKIDATTIVDEMLILQQGLGIPMVVGSVAFDNLRLVDTDEGIEYQRDAMYNSAFVLLDGQPQPVWYDKLHLTPFGEVMPYISSWPWLEHKLLAFGAEGMEFVLSPGKEPRVLTIPIQRIHAAQRTVSLATPICFEATISSVCRELVFKHAERQAGIMVNITNDGWFGSSDAGRETHLLTARWRCIELNTPMVRSANTGISSVIDHRGRVENRAITPMDESDPREGYLISDVVLAQGTTFYARIGDLFGWVDFIVMGILILVTIFRRSDPVETRSLTQSGVE